MLGFLKKLFKKEEDIIIESVKKHELRDWFDGKVKERDKEIKKKLDNFRRKISEKIKHVEQSLKELENAKLRNPNITVKEKHFMEGNRKNYTQRTIQFLRELEDILKHEISFFIRNYDECVSNLSKSTERSYRILQEFFANEAREVVIKIKEIDDTVNSIKKDENVHDYSKIEKINRNLESIGNNIQKQKDLKKEIGDLKDKISSLEDKKKELEETKTKTEKSKEYKDIGKDKDKLRNLEEHLIKMKKGFSNAFSQLDRPLRKYQRIAFKHDKLIEYYYSDSVSALKSDSNLNILEILEGMSKAISDGKLVLKDKISAKVLGIIHNMDKEYFTAFLKRYEDTIKERDEIKKRLKESPLESDYENILEKIEDTKSKIALYKKRLEDSKAELESINIDRIREKIRKEMEDVLNVKIEFS